MSDPSSPSPEEETRPYPDPEHSIAPRKPRTPGGVVYLLVLAATAVGLVLIILGPFRTGLSVMGVGLALGGLTRLVLSDTAAGMLGVRRKVVDVLTLTALGAGLLVLAVAIPGGPGPR